MHKIGNLRGLSEKLIAMAEHDGNEAEHQLGIALVNLAREEGLTEEQILEGLTAGKMHVRIESAMAKRHNEEVADIEGCEQRAETWEGYVPDTEAGNLEQIFRFFNRVDFGDGERLEEIGYTLPSLSVGDVVEWHGKRYRVEPVGWVEISAGTRPLPHDHEGRGPRCLACGETRARHS